MCATTCSFCKKSASQLVTHYLCDCCLVHLECCEATQDNDWASFANTIIPDEDENSWVGCEICLEKYPEEELEEHQEQCTARLVFRCSVCEGNYVSKEGLWNHLGLHDIADESKESHYQEIRVTYKLYKCVLCNDQRGYQESVYWQHIHEDHDGFFLRCLDCGINFRSEKRKADHISHCNVREQTETSVSTALALDSVYTEYCKKNSLIQPEKSDVDITNADAKSVDSQRSKDPPAGNCRGDTVEKELNMQTEISQPSIKKRSIESTDQNKCSYCYKEFDEKNLLARHIEKCHQPTKCDICGITAENKNQMQYHKLTSHKERKYKCPQCPGKFHYKHRYESHLAAHLVERTFSCEICGNKLKNIKSLSVHMTRLHQVEGAFKKLNAARNQDQQGSSNDTVALQTGNVTSSEESQSTSQDTTPNVPKDNGGKSQTEIMKHELVYCSICGMSFASTNQLQDHKLTCTHLNTNNISNMDAKIDSSIYLKNSDQKHVEEFRFKEGLAESACLSSNMPVVADQIKIEETSLSLVENTSSESSTIKCDLCNKLFQHKSRLASHIELCHKPTTCNICGKVSAGVNKDSYHRLKQHREPKYKCPHCPMKFHLKHAYYHHMASRVHEKLQERNLACEICGLRFKNPNCIRLHMKKTHNTTGAWKKVNDLQTDNKNSGEKSSTVSAKCPDCNKECHDESHLTHHISICHEKVKCNICGISISRSQLRYHKLKNHAEPMLSCPYCPNKYDMKTHLWRHYQTHHSQEKIPSVLRKSQLYKKLHTAKSEADSRSQVTVNPSKMKCPHCDEFLEDELELTHHVEKFHESTTEDISEVTSNESSQDLSHKLS